ncbi:MAG TPA: hypothetical protein VMW87_03695 [Spirochaetia bacterium]|nr:hypothetical protein [Spirochaetia bacterium]
MLRDPRYRSIVKGLQELADAGRTPDEATTAVIAADPRLASLWTGFTRIREELSGAIDAAVGVPPDPLPAVMAHVREIAAAGRLVGRGRATGTSRRLVLAVAAGITLAAGGFLFREQQTAADTRREVRREVAILVDRMYAADGPGLGAVSVPDRSEIGSVPAESTGSYVEGIMSAVAGAISGDELSDSQSVQ